MENTKNKRLESLDILRGFDLFCLVALEGIFHPLKKAINTPWFDSFMWNFGHVEWDGFSTWDLVMPLFMFMAGVSIPFALSRYTAAGNTDKKSVYIRIIKRTVLLWVFGMVCQGNLLALNSDKIYLFSNTLQAIAIGYFFAAILFLNFNIKIQLGIAGALLIAYWACMELITVGGYGGGNYTPDGNLAEWVDRAVLGRFRDYAAVDASGSIVFHGYYRYTWVLSSINFIVTVLTGVFAGYILKNTDGENKKLKLLFIAGGLMVAAGWLWGLQQPVIKKIWTSSMTLVSSGYCFLLMGLFYYLIDCKGHKKYGQWLKFYGMNSILAYMLYSVVRFSCIGNSLFFGLEQYMGNYYAVLIAASNAAIVLLILWLLFRKKIFLKV